MFAYGPADATVFPKPHRLLPHLNPDWFYLSGTGLQVVLEKRPLNGCSSGSGSSIVISHQKHSAWHGLLQLAPAPPFSTPPAFGVTRVDQFRFQLSSCDVNGALVRVKETTIYGTSVYFINRRGHISTGRRRAAVASAAQTKLLRTGDRRSSTAPTSINLEYLMHANEWCDNLISAFIDTD